MKTREICKLFFLGQSSAIAICILLSVESQFGYCDSEGNYPGTGDYSAWKQAADASEDGVIYAKKGNYTMAIRCYDEAIQLYPSDASFYFNKATALHKTSRPAEAMPMFSKAVALEPKFTSAWYNMGNAQKELNDLAGAEESFKRALSLAPKHMKAWFNLGETYFSSKKYLDAKNAFEHAMELSTNEQDKNDIANYRQELERILKKLQAPSTSQSSMATPPLPKSTQDTQATPAQQATTTQPSLPAQPTSTPAK